MIGSRMRLLVGVVICVACSVGRTEPLEVGPFVPGPVTTLYLVADGQPCAARLVVEATEDATAPPRVMARVFDPDDRPALWRYVEYCDAETVAAIEPEAGMVLRPDDQLPVAGQAVLDETVELGVAGVYQVRVVAYGPLAVRVELPRELPWGWCAQNGRFLPFAGQPDTMHVFVPPHAEQLRLRGGPVRVLDERGAVLADLDAGGSATIPVARTEVVWRVELPADGWRMTAADLPLILCPTEEAAHAIHGSVEMLDDGTVVCHRFQARVAEVLREVLAPEHVGDTEALIVPLSERREAWLADPLRSAVLMRSYLPTIEPSLRSQNLDPDSHWGGSLDGWQEFADKPGVEGRWDRLHGIDGLYAGASSNYDWAAEHLALAALYDDPTNPYFGREELLWRAAAAALRDLMALSEAEVWPGVADLDPYPGMMAFAIGNKTLPVYARAAPHLPERVRDVWTEGVRRIIDRCFADELVTCRNQSSHYLVSNQAFADGSGDPRARAMARLWARRWLRGMDPSGYHMEAIGPDASYIGMTHWYEAVYYRMSGDPVVLESLRRSYRLFNHTVGPEPEGRMLGGFNFNHRVGEGFYFEQFGGARGILDDVLPEVGLWAGEPPTEADVEAARERVSAFLDAPTVPPYPRHTTPRYLYFAEADRSGVWPCMEPEPFLRVVDDEWLFVNRPGYYAVCYLGKPAGDFYVRRRHEFRTAYPDDGESTGANLTDMKRITPFVGGGLSGVWTRDYGHSLMAANWSPTTHHGIIATDADGLRWWEDYHAHEHSIDADAGSLTVSGRIEGQPITYQRRYVFGDDALEVAVTLTAEEDVRLARLVECVPIARGGWKARGATIEAAGQDAGGATVSLFRVTDDTGAGVQFVLDDEHALALIPDGLKTYGWRQLQIGRVEIELPAAPAAGESIELRYVIRPVVP